MVLWGASQGGHAAFACNLLAPYYAPELDIRAMVASVPGTDLVGQTAYALGESSYATAYSAVALTTFHAWYEGTAPFTDLFTDDATSFYASGWTEQVFTDCNALDTAHDATPLETLFTQSAIDEATTDPDETWAPWYCYLSENSIATSPFPRNYDTPTLFVVGENDTLVHVPVAEADYDLLCTMGYTMEYLQCAGADHMDAAVWSLMDQHAWVRDRLDDVPLEQSHICQRGAPVTCTGQP